MIAQREYAAPDVGFAVDEDAREHERRPASFGMARLRWTGRGGGVWSCPTLLLDLSRGGALAIALGAPVVGERVEVRLLRGGPADWLAATVIGREHGDVRGRAAEPGVSTLRLAFADECPDAFLEAATVDRAD